jgi:uncharacterized protein with PIN domain
MTELLIEIVSWLAAVGFIAAIIADTFRWRPGKLNGPREAPLATAAFLSARSGAVLSAAHLLAICLPAVNRAEIGRHAARLNMGDRFAYACVKTRTVPLLVKGDDFSQTDVAVA